MQTFQCNKVAYQDMADHFSVDPITRTSSKSYDDWTEQIFSIDQRINDFFQLCSLSCNSSKHAKHVEFLLLITWWKHATLLARLREVLQSSDSIFRVFQFFFFKFSLALTPALFGIVSSPFSSPDSIQFTTLFSVQNWGVLASFLALDRGRSFAIFFAAFSVVKSCSPSFSFMLCFRYTLS